MCSLIVKDEKLVLIQDGPIIHCAQTPDDYRNKAMDDTIRILNPELADELMVVNAIYGDGTVIPTYSDENHTTVELLLPETPHPDDSGTFYLRFPASYPLQPPSVIGSSPLHRSSDPVIANDISYFRACFISCHTPGVPTLHDTISEFLYLREQRLQLTREQATTLCQRGDKAVLAFSERLTALAEAVQSAESRSTTPTSTRDPPPLLVDCGVCLEPVFSGIAARLPHCSHTFCSGCLQEGILNFLRTRSEFRCCGEFLPSTVVAKYGDLDDADLARYRDLAVEKVSLNPIYCHDRSCATFIPTYRITEDGARCPACTSITCTQCKRRHHEGMCRGEEKRFKNLAKKMNWKFCPSCNELVERSEGCKSISCRCGAVFCYHCGKQAPPGQNHATDCCLNGQLFDTMAQQRRRRR